MPDFRLSKMPPKKKTAVKGKNVVPPGQQEKVPKKMAPKQKEGRKNPPRQRKKLDTKTKKSPTKKQNETKKMTHKQGKKPCVVVYRTGECELFASEDQARIERQSLPAGMVKSYEVFETARLAVNFKKRFDNKKSADLKPSANSDDENSDSGKAMLPAAVTPPDKKKQVLTFLKTLHSPVGGVRGIGASKKPPTSFMTAIQHQAHCITTMLRLFVMKLEPPKQPKNYRLPTKQVIVLDIFDENKNATYWTHKPKTWINMFHTAEQMENTLFDEECYLLQSFQFRDLSSKHKSEPKFYENTSNRGALMKIPVDAFFALVPYSWTSSNILDFAVKVGKNLVKKHAKEAYECYYPSSSEPFRLCIQPTTGEYWKTIDGIFQRGNISIIQKEALSEIFTNDMVLDIMAEVFEDNQRPEDWDDEPRMFYAFGNLLDGAETGALTLTAEK